MSMGQMAFLVGAVVSYWKTGESDEAQDVLNLMDMMHAHDPGTFPCRDMVLE